MKKKPRGFDKLLNEKVASRHSEDLKAIYDLAVRLYEAGRFSEAVPLLRRVLKDEPNQFVALFALGISLRRLKQLDEGATALNRAIALKPDFFEAHYNLGLLLNEQGLADEAAHAFRRAIDLRPDVSSAHSNLLMALQYSSGLTTERWREALIAFAQCFPPTPPTTYANAPDPERVLRIGYVSPDFYQHSCAWFIEPLLKAHDRKQIEVFCYSQVASPDVVTARLRALSDGWREIVHHEDEKVATLISEDHIDILVDCAGHSACNRLGVFARKPAPVQVSWLGYPASTGLSAVDYRLSDPWLTPPDTSEYFSETIWNLEQSAHCYGPPLDAPAVAPAPVLKRGQITFGSFNNLTKVGRETVALWAAVLQAIPESRLLLKAHQASDLSVQGNLTTAFGAYGVLPQRIAFIGKAPTVKTHLAYYAQIDIALDTFPYNGATTTLESLWMGVPVVSLIGERAASRYGLAFLSAVGLRELAATDLDQFVATAVALAGDLERLVGLRNTLRGTLGSSTLCDAASFAQTVENAYRQMWRHWCANSG
ncbi:MAG: tetratricopeptide repeat protein [Anaerolineae bacterium]|nr:tetratricopeptide repeat protein [Gloeobacterales cyanobacterium ES-bin-313]